MKCPLKFRLMDYGAEIERIYTGDCLKGDCEWYDKDKKQCDFKSAKEASESIAKSLELITKYLDRLHSSTIKH